MQINLPANAPPPGVRRRAPALHPDPTGEDRAVLGRRHAGARRAQAIESPPDRGARAGGIAAVLELRASFTVHTFEIDAFGTLEVPALSGFLGEMAGRHAAELGVGMEAMFARGVTWVLARQRIEVPGEVRLGDVVEVTTWPAGIERRVAVRDFLVRRGGEEVARATTHWLVLDLATRRPRPPEGVVDPRLPRTLVPSVVRAPGRLPALAAWDEERRFTVRYSDIDVNLHVTHTSYLAWAVEAVPREVWQSARLAAVDASFLAECHHGSAVRSRLKRTGEGSFAHAIVREEDGKELARLASAWVGRGAGGRAR
jgi:acyl-ACP thioesterase